MHILTTRGEHDDTPIREWTNRYEAEFGTSLTVSDDRPVHIIETVLKEMNNPVSQVDAVAYAPMMIQKIVLQGGFADLSDFLNDSTCTFAETVEGFNGDFFSGYMEYASWVDVENEVPQGPAGKHLYGLPGGHTGASILITREDVFGNDHIDVPGNWEDFNRLAKELTNPKENIWGTAICAGIDRQLFGVDWYARFASQGGKLFKGNFAKRNVVSQVYCDAGVNACRWIKELIPLVSEECSQYKLIDCMKAMASGKVAMQLNVSAFVSPQMLYDVDTPIFGKIGIHEIPGANEHRGVGYGCGWSWAILKNSKDPISAWKMIQYFSSKEFDSYRCAKYGVTPVRRSTLSNPMVLEAQPWVKDLGPIIDKAVAPEYFYTPISSSIADAYASELMKGILANDKPEHIVLAMDEAANAVLKSGGFQK